MKTFLIFFFVGIASMAMAQKESGNNDTKRVTFDSPEATVQVVSDKNNTTTADRIVFGSPEATVKLTPSSSANGATRPRVEFTSPAATEISVTGKKDDE